MKKLLMVGFAVAVLASVAFGQTLVQEQKVVQALFAQDVNAIKTNTVWVSMKNYGHVAIVVQCGVINSSQTGITGTVQQASSVAGTGAKTLGSVSNYWVNGINGDIYTNTATTLNGFALTSASDFKTYIVEVDASQLDVANSFDCVRMSFDTPSAHSAIINAFYILSQPRYTGDAASQPSALID